MAGHTGEGINQRGTVLNNGPVLCVGVVRGPNLGEIMKDRRVESRSASGTALKYYFGICFDYSFTKVVESESKSVREFLLSVGKLIVQKISALVKK